jgi:two-component system cell cycle sensor histidine kinase/response regulator CckA
VTEEPARFEVFVLSLSPPVSPPRAHVATRGPDGSVIPQECPVAARSSTEWPAAAVSNDQSFTDWNRAVTHSFRVLVQNSWDAVTLMAADGAILYTSPATTRILGYDPEELAGRNAMELIHPDDRELLEDLHAQLLDQPGVSMTREYRAMHTDGTWRWIEGTVTNLLHEPGVAALVSNYRDVTERKRVAEELRAIAAKARCLLWHAEVKDTGGDAPCWSMSFVDEAAAERFLPVARAPGQSFLDAWYNSRLEDDRIRTDRYGHIEVRAGRSYYQEYRCACATGEIRWLAEDVQIETLGPGRWRAVGVCTDITERKRTEQALQESEASLARAQQIARLGSWEWDTRTNAVRWSDEIYRILGLDATPTGPTYEALFQLVHPHDRPRLLRSVFTALTQGKPFNVDHRIILPTGEVRSVNEQAEVIYDDDGRPLRFLGTVLDITERKQAEAALQASEERYRRIVETAQEGVWTVDAEMRTTYVNRRMADLLGYTLEEMLGRSSADFVDPTLHPQVARNWERRRRGIRERLDISLRRKDGSDLWAISSTNPLYGPDGSFVGSLAMVTDVTERKQLEQRLHQAQKMEAIGRVAGGIAHDFNNVLGAINGYAELLLQRVGAGSELREFLQQILKAGERATNLTHQLLAFSRKSVIEPRVIDLNERLVDLCPMLRRLVGERIELVALPAARAAWIKADPTQIEQVLLNVVINARDAMPRGGRLTVEISDAPWPAAPECCPDAAECGLSELAPWRETDAVLLTVSDTGCGMDAATQSRIFEPFFTTKPPENGTGLGLATVYGVVQQSGGLIEVESEPGTGSIFRVFFPRWGGGVPCAEEAALPLADTETQLLVEGESSAHPLTLQSTALGCG